MLIKGASREIKDVNGNTPLDVIDPGVFEGRRHELVTILDK